MQEHKQITVKASILHLLTVTALYAKISILWRMKGNKDDMRGCLWLIWGVCVFGRIVYKNGALHISSLPHAFWHFDISNIASWTNLSQFAASWTMPFLTAHDPRRIHAVSAAGVGKRKTSYKLEVQPMGVGRTPDKLIGSAILVYGKCAALSTRDHPFRLSLCDSASASCERIRLARQQNRNDHFYVWHRP